MAYASGRTVKSSKAVKSPVAQATAEARRLARKHLPTMDGVVIKTVETADVQTLAPLLKTTISYPETTDASDLACVVERAEGVAVSTWTAYAITIIRNA